METGTDMRPYQLSMISDGFHLCVYTFVVELILMRRLSGKERVEEIKNKSMLGIFYTVAVSSFKQV